MNHVLKPKPRTFVLYLLPGLLLFGFIVFVPILYAFYYGLFDWSGGVKKTWIGFQNYIQLFQDQVFWQSFVNNIILIALCIIGQIGLAFVFAVLLNSRSILFRSFHRTMAYLPAVLSAVVVGFIWSMVYDYNYGLLNTVLKALGFKSLVQPWLSNTKIALFLVSIPLIWQYIGYYLIILLAAFSSISKEIFEVAEIDGASGIKKAIYITFPLIRRTIAVCITLCIAGNIRAFDHIYVMTGGGPGTATNVMALYAYNISFIRYKMGYGSAMSILILVLSLLIIGGSQKLISTALNREDSP